ncbi:unnamed protein product, partial [Discosporangium mesarthrocarpum]
GVYLNDRVVGIGDHQATGYGTVLAFMNIVGRPLEVHFRKAELYDERGKLLPCRTKRTTQHLTGRTAGKAGQAGQQIRGALMVKGRATRGGRGREGRRGKGRKRTKRGEIRAGNAAGMGGKAGSGGSTISSPICPKNLKTLQGLRQEVASSDASFNAKMEQGVVVTKYGRKGPPAQKVMFLDPTSKSVGWRDISSTSPGHRRPPSLTNLLKSQRELLALSHLIQVIAGDEPDSARPTELGSVELRDHCDETVLYRSLALVFKERSLEMTCNSRAEMHQLVSGFRKLQATYSCTSK